MYGEQHILVLWLQCYIDNLPPPSFTFPKEPFPYVYKNQPCHLGPQKMAMPQSNVQHHPAPLQCQFSDLQNSRQRCTNIWDWLICSNKQCVVVNLPTSSLSQKTELKFTSTTMALSAYNPERIEGSKSQGVQCLGDWMMMGILWYLWWYFKHGQHYDH